MDPFDKKRKNRMPLGVYTVRRAPISQKEVSFGKDRREYPLLKQLREQLRQLWESFQKKQRSRRRAQTARKVLTEKRPKRRRITPPSWLPVAGIMGAAAAGLAVCAGAVLLIMNLTTTSVTINDSGRIVTANTTEETVGELLSKNGIVLDDNDVLEVSLSAKLQDNMEIVIRRANTVTVSDEAGDTQIKMLAGTVGEALERAGIELGAKDEVYPDTGTYVYAGMKINVIRVEVLYETQTEVLEYKEITKESDHYDAGKRILAQEGKTGKQENTIEVVYKNGKEYSREVIDTKVISEPQDEIVYIGTYVAPTPEPTQKAEATAKPAATKKPTATNKKEDKNTKEDTGANNPKDDDGKLKKAPSIEQIHSGTWKEHKAVAAPASGIIAKTITATRITAYTHTGNKTSTGIWPRIGTVAANPKQVPYGTKIYVPGYGYGRIEDTGSNKHDLSEYHFDLFMETEAECKQWGSQRNVKVYILKG